MLVPEGLLERVQAARGREALDGLHGAAVELHGQQRARLGRLAVDQHRAGAAVGGVTTDVGAGQAEDVAQQVHQQQARLDVGLAGLAVDGQGDVMRAHRGLLPLCLRTCAGERRPQRPRHHLGGHGALVLGGPVTVADRLALCRGGLGGAPDGVVGGLSAGEGRLGVRGRERGGRHGRQADADARDPAVLPELELDAGTHGGKVTGPPFEVGIRTAAPGPRPGDAHLGQDLGRLDGRLERVQEELAGRDGPLAAGALAHDRGAGGDEGGRPVS